MDRKQAAKIIDQITEICSNLPQVQIMEVCGTHTVSLFRSGVKSLLPESLRLISGPGCPVCVTSQGYIDAACELASRQDVTICTYGDMVRVPGKGGGLEQMRSNGAKVVVVYSARDALKFAQENPNTKVVFLAVGFETTTPPTAATLIEAEIKGVDNFFILPAHKLVIPAMEALLSGGEVPLDGFLCPGHVSVIIGSGAYKPIAEKYSKPCVVAGFEPIQMLNGILHIVEQNITGTSFVESVYDVVVSEEGNTVAQSIINKVFTPGDATWRAIGTIPGSGLDLRDQYKRFDAATEFSVDIDTDTCPAGCRCGEVIQGKVTPAECGLFGKKCTPVDPIGPCMVSSEGTCAAWYKYNRDSQT